MFRVSTQPTHSSLQIPPPSISDNQPQNTLDIDRSIRTPPPSYDRAVTPTSEGGLVISTNSASPVDDSFLIQDQATNNTSINPTTPNPPFYTHSDHQQRSPANPPPYNAIESQQLSTANTLPALRDGVETTEQRFNHSINLFDASGTTSFCPCSPTYNLHPITTGERNISIVILLFLFLAAPPFALFILASIDHSLSTNTRSTMMNVSHPLSMCLGTAAAIGVLLLLGLCCCNRVNCSQTPSPTLPYTASVSSRSLHAQQSHRTSDHRYLRAVPPNERTRLL